MPGADTALAAAERLKRVQAALAAGKAPEPDDAAWAALGLGRYFDAPDQLDLDRALGLATPQGGTPWWRVAATRARDQLLCELAAELPGRGYSRAVALSTRMRRYQSTAWPRERVSRQPTAANTGLFALFDIDADPPTGWRRLLQIIDE